MFKKQKRKSMRIPKITSTNYKSHLKDSTVYKEKNNKCTKTIRISELNSNLVANLNKANINFCGMKKTQFKGIDLIMVNVLTKTKGFNIISRYYSRDIR